MTSPIGKAKQIAGTATAAILLYRLQYWMKKTKITRNGQKWVVMSREEWLEELSMTLDEYRGAIRRLKTLNVIYTEKHLFKGKVHSFIRFTDEFTRREKEAENGQDNKGDTPSTDRGRNPSNTTGVSTPLLDNGDNPPINRGNSPSTANGNNPSIHIDNNNYLYKSELYKSEIKGVSSGSSPAGDFCPEQNLAPGEEKIKKIKPKNTRKIKHGNLENSPKQKLENSEKQKDEKMKVADVLQNLKGNKHNHRKDSVPQLTFLWKNLVSELFDVEFIHLTKQQCGMFKHFRDKCPKGEAAKILEWTLNNWIKFVKTVESRMGIKNTPAYPKVDFLLKHTDIAVDLHKKARNWKKELASAQLSAKLGNNLQLIAAKSSQEPPPPRRRSDQQPKSYSDLMSIIGSGSEK